MNHRERKVETRFARRAGQGRGMGLHEAVAAAEARIEGMRDDVQARIRQSVEEMQAARAAVIAGDPEADRFLRAEADVLVGLCGPFGLPEMGAAAFSLCQLFDACRPGRPAASAVAVHLDAQLMFQGLPPPALAAAAPRVLEGLRQVVAAAKRRPDAQVASAAA